MKIPRFAIAVTCVGLIAMMAGDVLAQGRGRGRGGGMFGRLGGGSLLSMIGNEEVQKELKLEDEQIKKITEFREDLQAEAQEKFQELRDSGDMQGIREAMQEMQASFGEREREAMKEVLNDMQLERYNQLRIQRMGINAINDEEFAKSIGLTDDDRQAIQDLTAEFQEEMRDKMMELRDSGDFESMREVIGEMREELEKKIMDSLSDEQKKKWDEAKGEKFEFPQQRRGRQKEDF